MSSKETPKGARKSSEQVVTEPRFAKAHTDKRFSKISKKDRTVHLDSRFKHIVKDRKYAIAAQKDARGRDGDVVSKAKIQRQTKGLLENFHVDSDEDEKVLDDEVSAGTATSAATSDHEAHPKTQAAQTPRKSKSGSASGSSGKFLVEDNDVSSDEANEEAEADYWAKKARGELESSSVASGDFDEEGSTGDEFSSDSEADLYEEEAEAYEEGVLHQEVVYGEETHRIAIINCDWERLGAVDLLVVCSSFAPSTGLVKSVHIYPSDFGLSMMDEENRNGPAIYKSDSEEEVVDKKTGQKKRSEEQQKALDEIKLRRYELNKLRYYFAVVTCDSIATASQLYLALDNQEVEMSSNKLDMRFVPDDISFNDRPVHDVATEIPLNYEAPSFYTTVLQKTEAKLTWDQTPKDRLAVTQAAFSHLGEIDESKFSKYIASSESESEEDTEHNAPTSSLPTDPEADTSKIKNKQRQKYAALLLGLDTLEDEDANGEDDFFTSKPVEGNLEFTLGPTSTKKSKTSDKDEEIKRKVQEKLEKKPTLAFKANTHRAVKPKYRPDENLEEEDEIHLDENASGDEETSDSEEVSTKAAARSKSDAKGKKKHQKSKSGDDMEVDEEDAGEEKGDIWAGFEEAFEKPSKSALAKMKKRKREERETALKNDKQTRAELRLLMDKKSDFASDGDESDENSEDESGAPKRKKRSKQDRREKKQEVSDINLQDDRFQALYKDPRFMPDPTNPNFKKTTAVQAILEARKDYRKTHETRADDLEEDDEVETHKKKSTHSSTHKSSTQKSSATQKSSKTSQLHEEASTQRKVQRGFYDQSADDSKASSSAGLDDLVASVKRKAAAASSSHKKK